MAREIKFAEAVLEATDQCLAEDPSVYLMGLGVPDPKGVFGTTLGLQEKHGPRRVMDMPTSENAMTGVAVGSAIAGMRPIMVHQRVDFFLLAFDQIINHASKWHYMSAGKTRVPMVVRLIIGRGWGQGPQHSQSLESVFAHFPGLKVLMPATPGDAKGLLVAAVRDDNPVVFLEHRWLHGVFGPVPEEPYAVPIGKARIARPGTDVTLVAAGYMTLESLQAARMLEEDGVSAEVVDLRTLRPLDAGAVLASAEKTGRLVAVDNGWRSFGFGAEIVALAAEKLFGALKAAPARVSPPDVPIPSAWGLSNHYYPTAAHIADAALGMMGKKPRHRAARRADLDKPQDTPNKAFTGPF